LLTHARRTAGAGEFASDRKKAKEMMRDSHKRYRRSIRLKDCDYTSPGAYFVTICIQGRLCLFGDVVNGNMVSNDTGKMIEFWWVELIKKFSTVQIDSHIIMPNHFHGIIVLVGADLRVCPDEDKQKIEKSTTGAHTGAPLSKIVQWFKTMTTNGYIQGVKQSGWLPFSGKLWQRNYYEHIIRNDRELNAIREYIWNNPRNWSSDSDNPQQSG
jgi:REP element-mobilizing transposase RayT